MSLVVFFGGGGDVWETKQDTYVWPLGVVLKKVISEFYWDRKQIKQVKFHKKNKLSFIDKLLQNIFWTDLVTYLGKLTHGA